MLTKGDLVRIKQGTFMYPISLEPWYIKKLKTPEYGVVIKKQTDSETKVLVEENTWIIEDKCLQLVDSNHVYKTKQSK